MRNYIPLLVSDILRTLITACKHLRLSKDCSLEFVSQLVGKLCVCGYAGKLNAFKLCTINKFVWTWLFFFFFSVQLLSVLRGHSFFHPHHNGQWPPTLKDFYTRSYPLHYFLILILEKEPVFPFSMFSAKQGKYWYHFYNVFGMTRSLTGDWTWDLPHSTTIEEAVMTVLKQYKFCGYTKSYSTFSFFFIYFTCYLSSTLLKHTKSIQ